MAITERQLLAGRLYWHKYAGARAFKHTKPTSCMLDKPFIPKVIRRTSSKTTPTLSITDKILDCMASGAYGLREAIAEVYHA